MSATGSEPPEVLLTVPPKAAAVGEPGWRVVARNRRVNRDWEGLIERAPEQAARWYAYLCRTPMTRYPGRAFPLRGSVFAGAWECEVTEGDRVFYRPDPTARKVVVYYAGPHPKRTPQP